MPATRKNISSETASKSGGRKPTLSPTRINIYLECAVKYKYIYQDKIGRFYTKARAGYSFGSTLHNVLQDFHEQGATHTPEEMVEELQQKWIGAGYESQEQEQAQREAGQQIVQAYHIAHQERIQAQVETVATEKTISCDMGRFKLSGRVDRIDRHADGRLEIIDYKSGRWDTSAEEVANSLAMCCYQLILKRQYPESPVCGTIYCLRSGNQATAELADDTLEEFARELTDLGNNILADNYDALRPVPLEICPECDFLPRCARYWRAIERQSEPNDAPFSEDGV
jgi:putative RecB family exonuclease